MILCVVDVFKSDVCFGGGGGAAGALQLKQCLRMVKHRDQIVWDDELKQ